MAKGPRIAPRPFRWDHSEANPSAIHTHSPEEERLGQHTPGATPSQVEIHDAEWPDRRAAGIAAVRNGGDVTSVR